MRVAAIISAWRRSARLKPGVSPESARAEMAALARQLELEYPNTNSGNGGTAQPLFEVLVSRGAADAVRVLLGSVIAMLLIACVNLANLMLARAASSRAQEMAVRRSLGAARWRIARQMLTESLLLSTIGGIAGVALAYAGFERAGDTPAARSGAHSHRSRLIDACCSMAAAASLASGVLFGLMPAIQAATGRSLMLLRSARVTGASHVGRGNPPRVDAGRSRAGAGARHRRGPDAAHHGQFRRGRYRVRPGTARHRRIQSAAAL